MDSSTQPKKEVELKEVRSKDDVREEEEQPQTIEFSEDKYFGNTRIAKVRF